MRLRWLGVGLVVLSVAVAVAFLLAVGGAQSTVDTSGHTEKAVVDLSSARHALLGADRIANCSLTTPQALLIGPGTDYQNQIDVASQSLTKLAQDNVVDGAKQELQLVEELLVTYTGLIEQADADYRLDATLSSPQSGSARVALWNAWLLLHKQLLDELDKLERMEVTALTEEASSGWMATWVIPLWMAPPFLLLALLVVTQVFRSRRFRRTLNLWLMLATAGLFAASAYIAYGIVDSHRQLDDARGTLSRATQDWKAGTTAHTAVSLATLDEPCFQKGAGCGDAVAALRAGCVVAPNGSDADSQKLDKQVTQELDIVDKQVTEAGPGLGREVVAVVAPLFAVALTALGLLPLLDQYRYRPR